MKNLLIAIFISFSMIGFAKAPARLQVATTTTDLAVLVQDVTQGQVDVFSIAKGTQDPHQIDAKPSFMVKLRNTDLIILQGLELESAWIDPLIQGSRNSKLRNKNAILELAAELEPIEKSTGSVSRAEGDVHPGGNPHFQLDPIRLGQASVLIAKRLGELNPAQKDFYLRNAESFQKKMIAKTKDWLERIKKIGLTEIVTYHKTFSYFCDRFEIQCRVQLEPKPGIPPTAGHLLEVIDQMKKRKIHLVLIENLYDDSVKSKLEQAVSGVSVIRAPVSVGGEPEIKTNEQLIERLVQVIENGK
jgi:zinc/manganese transport system substrate-binding protein